MQRYGSRYKGKACYDPAPYGSISGPGSAPWLPSPCPCHPEKRHYRFKCYGPLAGIPLGASAASLSDRYAAMLVVFHGDLEQLRQGEDVDLDNFALARMAERDARSYLVFGDPAVRPLG